MSRRQDTRERPQDAATGRSGPDRRLVAAQLVAGLAVCGFGWGTSLAGIEPFRGWWFDLVWSGFILAADAVVWARAGRSLLHGGGWRVVGMFALSAIRRSNIFCGKKLAISRWSRSASMISPRIVSGT